MILPKIPDGIYFYDTDLESSFAVSRPNLGKRADSSVPAGTVFTKTSTCRATSRIPASVWDVIAENTYTSTDMCCVCTSMQHNSSILVRTEYIRNA